MNESPLRPVPLRRRFGRRCSRTSTAFPARYLQRHHVALGGEAPGGVRRRHPQVPRRASATPRCCARSASPRPSRATRTTRTSPRWSARSTSASSRRYAQDDPDAYSYSGGLCLANQGLLEFVEMFKAPIKVLHPLLTATQEGNFKGTEGFGAIPFDGIDPGPLERVGMAALQATTRTTRPSSTASTSSRCPTACGCQRRGEDLREAGAQLARSPGTMRARNAAT